jgi:hypothetical protein
MQNVLDTHETVVSDPVDAPRGSGALCVDQCDLLSRSMSGSPPPRPTANHPTATQVGPDVQDT